MIVRERPDLWDLLTALRGSIVPRIAAPVLVLAAFAAMAVGLADAAGAEATWPADTAVVVAGNGASATALSRMAFRLRLRVKRSIDACIASPCAAGSAFCSAPRISTRLIESMPSSASRS